MIEIPEAAVLAFHLNNSIKGKTIKSVKMNQSPHKFAWFNGDPQNYETLLKDKVIEETVAYNGLVEIKIDDARLLLGDGVNLRYYESDSKYPIKHQLYIEFNDRSKLIGTIQMYGGMWAFIDGEYHSNYYLIHKQKPSVTSELFNLDYFKSLLIDQVKTSSIKAFLATEQRIPGLGNGVLQDILYHAKIHPKRKMNTLSDDELNALFCSIKNVIQQMIVEGGRDTERNLFGQFGGYKTKLSKHTVNTNCSICGNAIKKEAYLGGSIYFCDGCQE